MFARVTTIQGQPGRTASPELTERVTATLQKLPGFKGVYVLTDQNTGEGLGISFWETEQDAKALDQSVAPLREEGAREVGATAAPTSKVYEVTDAGAHPDEVLADLQGLTVA